MRLRDRVASLAEGVVIAIDALRANKVRAWLDTNVEFERYALTELRRRGPLLSRELEGYEAYREKVRYRLFPGIW